MFRNRFKATLLALCAFGVVAPAALASDGTSVVVSGGSLTITNPLAGNFAGVTLNGTNQTTTASLDAFSVTDARGTGAGWHVSAYATRFTGTGHSLATSSLTMSEPTVSANGTSSPGPTVDDGPYTIDVADPVQFASAAVDEGMGRYDFGQTTLTLSVPSSTYAETYNSTVTISVDSAP